MSEQQYHDLVEGDVWQEGDQYRYNNTRNWGDIGIALYGRTIEAEDIRKFSYRRPNPNYTVTELHTPSGALDGMAARMQEMAREAIAPEEKCERLEKALKVAAESLRFARLHPQTRLVKESIDEALAQINSLTDKTE